MLRKINQNILTGLITLLPVILTLYLLYWFILTTEAFLGRLIRIVLSDTYYWPGMGFAVGVIVAFFVGVLMHTIIAQKLLSSLEKMVQRVPLVKSIYLSIRDLLDYFSAENKSNFEQVVAIQWGDTGMQIVGVVTQTNATQMPAGLNQSDDILVYIPMSYGIGGFAVLVPRKSTRPLNMSMEEAMRFALTAGVTSKVNLNNPTPDSSQQ